MAIQRIDRVQQREQLQSQDQIQQQARQRLQLFTDSAFEKVSSVNFGKGNVVAIPSSLGTTQADSIAKTLNNATPEARVNLEQAASQLADAIANEATVNPDGLTTGTFSAGLQQAVENTFEHYVATSETTEYQDDIHDAMFMGMAGIEGDLGNFAAEVQGNIDAAGDLRTDITELRDAIVNWPDDGSTQSFDGKEITKEQAEELLGDLELELTSLTDMNEMMRFDLQTMTQNYQQSLNTLSAMLKDEHDTLKAMIQNMRG